MMYRTQNTWDDFETVLKLAQQTECCLADVQKIDLIEAELSNPNFIQLLRTYTSSVTASSSKNQSKHVTLNNFLLFVCQNAKPETQQILFCNLEPHAYLPTLLENLPQPTDSIQKSLNLSIRLLSPQASSFCSAKQQAFWDIICTTMIERPKNYPISILTHCLTYWGSHDKLKSHISTLYLFVALHVGSPIDRKQEMLVTNISPSTDNDLLPTLLLSYAKDAQSKDIPPIFFQVIEHLCQSRSAAHTLDTLFSPLFEYCVEYGLLNVLYQYKAISLIDKSFIQDAVHHSTTPIEYQHIQNLSLSPEDLAVMLFSAPPRHGDVSNIFLFFDELTHVIQRLPREPAEFVADTCTHILKLLEPAFCEYHRLDKNYQTSTPFLRLTSTLLSKGGRSKSLPLIYLDVVSNSTSSLKKSSPEYAQYRYHSNLRYQDFLKTHNPSWTTLFSWTLSARNYRRALIEHLSYSRFAPHKDIQKHAFAIRFLVLWRHLSLLSFIYSFFSISFTGQKLRAILSKTYSLTQTELALILTPNQLHHVKLGLSKYKPSHLTIHSHSFTPPVDTLQTPSKATDLTKKTSKLTPLSHTCLNR